MSEVIIDGITSLIIFSITLASLIPSFIYLISYYNFPFSKPIKDVGYSINLTIIKEGSSYIISSNRECFISVTIILTNDDFYTLYLTTPCKLTIPDNAWIIAIATSGVIVKRGAYLKNTFIITRYGIITSPSKITMPYVVIRGNEYHIFPSFSFVKGHEYIIYNNTLLIRG